MASEAAHSRMGQSLELYDLKTDPGEEHNVANEQRRG